MWKIVKSSDNQHIGELVNIPSNHGDLVFEDGDAVYLTEIKLVDSNTVTLISTNCIFTAVKVV